MRTRVVFLALLSILIAFGATGLFLSPLGKQVELSFLDRWFDFRGKLPPPKDLLIISIDEESYRNLRVPLNQIWPRDLHAQLLTTLSELGAKRVLFDVLFLDPSSNPNADKDLEESLKKIPTFLGVESSLQQVSSTSGSFVLEELLEPFDPFKKAAAGVALVTLPEEDGRIRNFYASHTDRTENIQTFGEAGADIAAAQRASLNLPTQRDFLNYYGPARTIPTLSYYQVLEKERPLPRKLFEGKTVFVGLSLRSDVGPSRRDVFTVPFSNSQLFGVEIHATAAANLIDKSWIRRLPSTKEALLIFSLALIGAFLILNLSPLAGGASVCGAALLWIGVGWYSFLNDFFLPGATLFFGTLPIVYTGATLYSFLITRRSEQRLRSAFELYLAPEMVAELQEKKRELKLGGQKVWATALFTDITGFTDIAEQLPAEQAAEMLNDYFSQVVDVVFQNKGTLIKFIGDAVFVIWGAPVPIDNHASLALQAGIQIERAIEKFNALKRYPELKTRIGLHTGPMLVGNLGSRKRFDYTAVGDSVNLASRVEGLNKHFGTTILFTESLRKDAGQIQGAVLVGDCKVKGKQEAIRVYTVFESELSQDILDSLDKAIKAFRGRQWLEAQEAFRMLIGLEPRLTKICTVYLDRIVRILDSGLPNGWTGEVVFES